MVGNIPFWRLKNYAAPAAIDLRPPAAAAPGRRWFLVEVIEQPPQWLTADQLPRIDLPFVVIAVAWKFA